MTQPEPVRVDLNTEAPVVADELGRLVRFLRVNIFGLSGCILTMVAIAIVLRVGRMWVILGILALLLVIVIVAERLAHRQTSPAPGLTLFALGVWIYALSTVALAPFLLPVNLLVLLLPIIFPIVLMTRTQAVRLLIGTGLTGYATVLIATLMPPRFAPEPPRWAHIVIIVAACCAVISVKLYGLAIVFQRASRQRALLHESRARVVAVALQTRRAIERDLHDGAQQRLVSTSVRLTLADRLIETDPVRARETLHEAGTDLRQALEDLRELAHGIYPPLLKQRGLAAALGSATRRATFPVALHLPADLRLHKNLEATIYFCCLEAIQNAAKHARPDQVDITVGTGEDVVQFEIHDDGLGFDPEAAYHGSGLINMADRLSALGGDLDIESAPGRGTTVRGRLPLHGEAAGMARD